MESDILSRRLRSQRISAAKLDTPAEVVEWLVAAQAQDFAGAKWALALRMRRPSEGDLERAFADGEILRTHLLRPTWHFVTPDDIRWLLDLTAPRVHATNTHQYRQLGLTRSVLKRSNDVIGRSLEGGQHRTRDEIREILEGGGVRPGTGQRMGYILMCAELDGVVCSGPRKGKQFTYALLDERAPRARRLRRDEALGLLAARYFRSRGPATVHDLAKWSDLTVAEAGRGLEISRGDLREEAVDGRGYWSGEPPRGRRSSGRAALLSIYDEYFSSYRDPSLVAGPDAYGMLRAMGNALTGAVVLDGRIIGTWKRVLAKSDVRVAVDLFVREDGHIRRELESATARFGRYLGLPAALARRK